MFNYDKKSIVIRSFTKNDYQAVVDIHNANWPDKPTSIEEMVNDEKFHRNKDDLFQRFVLELDNKIIGFAHIGYHRWLFHPQKFEIEIQVHPNYQGNGYGKVLYEYLLQKAKENQAIALRIEAREDQQRTILFLKDRGFSEEMRSFESKLDINSFDFRLYQGIIEQVEADGYQLTTLNHLKTDSYRMQKLYQLKIKLDQDLPSVEPPVPLSLERFKERTFTNKNLLPDAYFIAVKDGEYVGISILWGSKADSHLHNGLTGVAREHRRRKIALALKLKGIEYAKKHGFDQIYTFNNSINQPMLSINDALGFVKQLSWLHMIRNLENQ